MVFMTCENHPNLRWMTKPEAVWLGRYTGARNIFYIGEITDPVQWSADGSMLECRRVPECSCSGSSLIVAPENKTPHG